MKKEKNVKGYTRKSKSGKMVNVKPYSAKYDSAEDIKKMKMTSKKGSGSEFADLKKSNKISEAISGGEQQLKELEDGLKSATSSEQKNRYEKEIKAQKEFISQLKSGKSLKVATSKASKILKGESPKSKKECSSKPKQTSLSFGDEFKKRRSAPKDKQYRIPFEKGDKIHNSRLNKSKK